MSSDLLTPNDVRGGLACPNRSLARGWLLFGLLVLAGFASLAVDRPVSHWCQMGHMPGDLQAPIDWSEVFGHGVGVAILLLVVWTLDPARRWAVARLAAVAYGAGLTADLVKLIIARTRPRAFDFEQGIVESFGRLFPMGAGGSDLQSIPSAHVATAMGLALGLTWLYPRGRWLFLVLVAMVATQRVSHGAHFFSDTFFGAAVGCLVAILLFDVGPVSRWFDRKEAEWRKVASQA
ncbi:MAG: phosphatase PAP2 family protein [Pirellulales bacterium]|nr:phosphatase PAP2 family protein [Pirellulales bacterium]